MIVDNESVSVKCESVVENVTINLDDIYSRIVPLNTVISLCAEFADDCNELLIVYTTTSDAIQTVVILNPECNVPGLIILPTIILSGENIALESGAHCLGCVLTL